MSAYATAQIGRSSLSSVFGASRASFEVATRAPAERIPVSLADSAGAELLVLDALFDKLAARRQPQCSST